MVSSTSLLALVLLLFGSLQVSLPPIGEDFSCNFPLKRLTEEYTKYNVDIDDMSCKAGIYFAIATVFPSSKVLKDGVKLSWGLSCTTGIPTFEETIFICPIKTSDHSSNNNRINHAHMYKCTSLYLNLIQPKSNPGMLDNVPSDNGYASPETLLPRSRVNSWSITSCIDSTICLDTLSVNLSLKDEMANELLQRSASRWLRGHYLLNGNIVVIPLMFGKVCFFTVEDGGKHNDSFLVDAKIKVYFSPSAVNSNKSNFLEEDIRDTKANDMTMLGGLSREITDLKEIIMFSLASKGQNLPRYKGVLLYGPPDTGKASLARYCTSEANAYFFSTNGVEIINEYFDQSEQTLHGIYDSAKQAPSVIFIDEFELAAPSIETRIDDLSLRIVPTLLKFMDELKSSDDDILLIAAADRPDNICSSLRRRFDPKI